MVKAEYCSGRARSTTKLLLLEYNGCSTGLHPGCLARACLARCGLLGRCPPRVRRPDPGLEKGIECVGVSRVFPATLRLMFGTAMLGVDTGSLACTAVTPSRALAQSWPKLLTHQLWWYAIEAHNRPALVVVPMQCFAQFAILNSQFRLAEPCSLSMTAS